MSTLQERIAEVMAETGWTVGDMAAIAGVTSSAVSQWKDGPTKSIGIEAATQLSKRSRFSALWISTGKGPKIAIPQIDDEALVDVGAIELANAVPVVGFAMMGNDGYFDLQEADTPHGFVPYLKSPRPMYGLKVRGASMVPALMHGQVVVVDPGGRLVDGRKVAIALVNGRKLVKKLISHKGGWLEVESINGGKIEVFAPEDVQSAHPVLGVFEADVIVE